MKTRLFFFAAALFSAHLTTAQVLYTEDFESYNTGTFSTDLTGATQAQGGWHTLSTGFNGTASVNDYKIVADPNKGNVLKLIEGRSFENGRCRIYRTDLSTYWQQRTIGNNVLKLAFDIYTELNPTDGQQFYVTLFNVKEEVLLTFNYRLDDNFSSINIGERGLNNQPNGLISPLIKRTLPSDSWVTVELYIDYDNNQVYFSIPSLNHTVVLNTKFPLFLTGGGDHDDNPVKLEISNGYHNSFTTVMGMKIDNINLSAQNFTPTVSINEFVSDKFNIFPNPATDAVTITNNENIGIKEVSVYDITGKIVKLQKFKKENKILLNTEYLNSGTYFLHIVTDEGTGIKKLVKK